MHQIPSSAGRPRQHLQRLRSSQFTVGTVDTSGTSHILVAHYAWDGTNSDGSASGADSSGNGYDMNFGGGFGGAGGANSMTDPAAGPRAIQFHDGDGNSAGLCRLESDAITFARHACPAASPFPAGSRHRKRAHGGWDQAPAYYGAGIVSADNSGQANDVIPIALTGSKIGFNTGGDVEDMPR